MENNDKPTVVENTKSNEENAKTNKGLKVALALALILFVGTGIYTLNLYQDSVDTKKQLTEEKRLVMTDLNAMAKQYDDAIGENEEINADLVESRARIQGLIDSLKISETNIKSLWRYRQRYNTLKKEMDVLLAQNDSLRVQNSYLATSLDSTKIRLEERTMFTDSLLTQNIALAEVVENASVLNTIGLKGFGVIQRTSGKLVPTERARRVNKIRVCFTVAKNELVQAGDQELYIQVIDPNNNIMGLNQQVQFGEVLFNYSTISKFNYENANLDICEFVNSSNEKFEPGSYTVNVYNQRYLVSTSEFSLR
ncbi:chromosome partitioning protein ParA [Oceanihabitans sp. IOP_32]|uniref:chromosome partitioning protein ParA n=1 Tax=Oceanihabitans sp. IOP_32 TaxID=2529032 RepID=UPI001293B89C|nr:chromosome partitioning protein ParA [Oceanihabitans sp. IOP_32]QFZ53406.1 chromosome partitioning protein ParA [Oceanihabitans sp. IOP_32]